MDKDKMDNLIKFPDQKPDEKSDEEEMPNDEQESEKMKRAIMEDLKNLGSELMRKKLERILQLGDEMLLLKPMADERKVAERFYEKEIRRYNDFLIKSKEKKSEEGDDLLKDEKDEELQKNSEVQDSLFEAEMILDDIKNYVEEKSSMG